jgi:outer membrane protein TolC
MKRMIKVPAIFIFLFFSGCSLKDLEKNADKEVYGIIEEKKIEISKELVPEELVKLDDGSSGETIFVNMKDAIIFAVKNNRDYKSKQEDVYLNILNLTYQRYLFRTRYNISGNVGWNKAGDETVSGSLGLNVFRWLATGAQITFDMTKDFLHYLTGDKSSDLPTIISLNLLQPLLRGAGRAIAQENLVQAERDAIYSIRNFIRYQNSFSVDTTERYLSLLLKKNSAENIYNNYESLKATRERVENLSEAGRLPPFQVDQAKQSEFAAYQNWVRANNSYITSLDSFKIFLGLPAESNLNMDGQLLEHLINVGIDKPEIKISEYLATTLQKRLDLLTYYDRVEDAKRGINIALDELKPEVNVRLGVKSSLETKSFPDLDIKDPTYNTRLTFNLPLNKLPERNKYKRALLDLNRKERDFESMRNNIILEVSQQYNNLEEFYQSYLIQLNSLNLAEKRIESTNLLLQAGRATTRDLLEAEESYLQAKNALSSSVVNFLISHLKFLYATENLELDNTGLWKGDLYEKITKQNI